MEKEEHLTKEGLKKIVSIRASMNWGLSDKLKIAFPDITPVERPAVEVPENIDPKWLVGFLDGEACFSVKISKSKSCKIGFKVQLIFAITQHSRDFDLINSLVNYLNCGILSKDSRNPFPFSHLSTPLQWCIIRGNQGTVYFTVVKLSDINSKILPFLDQYPLQSAKSLDYADFCKIAELMELNAHLTNEGPF